MSLFSKEMVSALLEFVEENTEELYPPKGFPASHAVSNKAWQECTDMLNGRFGSKLEVAQVRSKMKELKRSRTASRTK